MTPVYTITFTQREYYYLLGCASSMARAKEIANEYIKTLDVEGWNGVNVRVNQYGGRTIWVITNNEGVETANIIILEMELDKNHHYDRPLT